MSADPGNAWATLVRAALVGTERMPALESLPALATDLSITEADAAPRLLAQASAMSVLVKAGQVAPKTSSDRSSGEAASETHPPAGPIAAHALLTILTDLVLLMPEWCRAAQGKRRVPDHLLPVFLDHLVKERNAETAEAMRAVLGRRGEWLALQNPAWGAAAGIASEQAEASWATGTKPERMRVLAVARQREPAAGRALLAGTAAGEPPEDLADFVAVLEQGLSMDDHDFLEGLLDARHKAVRVAAARLLAKLPQSQRSQRNIRRANQRLEFDPGKGGLLRRAKPSIAVTLPEKDDPAEAKALARDGIDTGKKRGKLGPKAVTLLHVIAGTPLSHFTQAWRAEPEAILDAALDGEWSEALLLGFAEAAYHQRDGDWAEALMERFAGRAGGIAAALEMGLGGLFQLLPSGRQEAFLARVLEERPRGIHDAWVQDLLAAMTRPWSEDFTRRFFAVARSNYLYEQHWALRSLLPRLAMRMHPSAASYAGDAWPADSSQWSDGDRQMLATLCNTLALRRNYLRELSA